MTSVEWDDDCDLDNDLGLAARSVVYLSDGSWSLSMIRGLWSSNAYRLILATPMQPQCVADQALQTPPDKTS